MATLQDCIDSLNDLVEDVVSTSMATRWFNQAQNRMASAVEATFTQLTSSTSLTATLDMPDKWVEALVLFAAAKYKEVDTSLQEAGNFMGQFQEVYKEFVENYQVPIQFLDNAEVQQYTAVAGQTKFTITKRGFSPAVGVVKVFVNGIETTDFVVGYKDIDPVTSTPTIYINGFTLTGKYEAAEPLADGDKVTVKWEVHGDFTQAPYSWWGEW
jgi:hypothetical protein